MSRGGWLTRVRPRLRWAPTLVGALLGCTSTVRQLGGDADGGAGAGAIGATGGGSSAAGGTGGAGGTSGASGRGGSGGSTDAGVIDCAEYARVNCEVMNRCSPFLVQLSHGDVASCREFSALYCSLALSASGARPEGAASCVDALAAASCETYFNGELPACRFSGTGQTGDACAVGSQCASGVCLESSGASACGECLVVVPEGGDCSAAICAAGLTCSNDVCVHQPGQGEACALDVSCRSPYTCVGGTCGDPLPLGAPCDQNPSGCAILQGQICLPDPNAMSICQAYQLVGLGDNCGFTGGVLRECLGGLTCSLTTSVCVERPAPGGACDDANNVRCLTPARCVNAICELPDVDACGPVP
jgi:hypothetical protein